MILILLETNKTICLKSGKFYKGQYTQVTPKQFGLHRL